MSAASSAAPDCAGRNGVQSHGKHTPGPWYYGISYEPERGSVPFDYVSPGFYENSGILAADGTTVVGCGEYHIFNSPADARLMAAAPELADCIHDLLYLHMAHHNHPLHAKARALLAKAEGRS